MRKLLLLCVTLCSFQAVACIVVRPTVCGDNSWVEIFAWDKGAKKYSHMGYSPQAFCILPNGEYYLSWQLDNNKDKELKYLFDQYSEQSPSLEQVESAKKQIREDGYLVD